MWSIHFKIFLLDFINVRSKLCGHLDVTRAATTASTLLVLLFLLDVEPAAGICSYLDKCVE